MMPNGKSGVLETAAGLCPCICPEKPDGGFLTNLKQRVIIQGKVSDNAKQQ